jgi:hypothetical protein
LERTNKIHYFLKHLLVILQRWLLYVPPKGRMYFPLSLGNRIQKKLIDKCMGLTRHKERHCNFRNTLGFVLDHKFQKLEIKSKTSWNYTYVRCYYTAPKEVPCWAGKKGAPDLSAEDGTENAVCCKERKSDGCYYLFDLIPPPSGASHAPPTTTHSRLSNQSVSESSEITPDVPSLPTLTTPNIEPISVIIHRHTTKFFAHFHSHPNPLVRQTGNYTLAYLTDMYRKYKHKRICPNTVIRKYVLFHVNVYCYCKCVLL